MDIFSNWYQMSGVNRYIDEKEQFMCIHVADCPNLVLIYSFFLVEMDSKS